MVRSGKSDSAPSVDHHDSGKLPLGQYTAQRFALAPSFSEFNCKIRDKQRERCF